MTQRLIALTISGVVSIALLSVFALPASAAHYRSAPAETNYRSAPAATNYRALPTGTNYRPAPEKSNYSQVGNYQVAAAAKKKKSNF